MSSLLVFIRVYTLEIKSVTLVFCKKKTSLLHAKVKDTFKESWEKIKRNIKIGWATNESKTGFLHMFCFLLYWSCGICHLSGYLLYLGHLLGVFLVESLQGLGELKVLVAGVIVGEVGIHTQVFYHKKRFCRRLRETQTTIIISRISSARSWRIFGHCCWRVFQTNNSNKSNKVLFHLSID